jgi:hypothetical protein
MLGDFDLCRSPFFESLFLPAPQFVDVSLQKEKGRAHKRSPQFLRMPL